LEYQYFVHISTCELLYLNILRFPYHVLDY